jgi:hypothetical protein
MLPASRAASAELRQQLQPEAQQQLLELALMKSHVALVDALHEHLGWQVSQAAVVAALQHHIAAGDHLATQRLASTREARQLTVEQTAELMHAAVQQRQPEVLDELFCASAAPDLNREQLDQLLDAACESQSAAVLAGSWDPAAWWPPACSNSNARRYYEMATCSCSVGQYASF